MRNKAMREKYEGQTWRGPDGVIHAIDAYGVVCRQRVARRPVRNAPHERVVTCLFCVGVVDEDEDAGD